ncbi:hypothetical protein FMUND_7763 [Fusarium mundagurra]|uniref:Uncharacterized protein n=1 Tax=Fusarium mundagurra TaxID=1567541 RepID=A0A8H5YK33_9HYPO|nr:hypothetical protein FMUND_7763 [Fusarium mundagurra]
MNRSTRPSTTSGPQTHGQDIWRVFAMLFHNGELLVNIRRPRPDDPPLRDWTEFRSVSDMHIGTHFYITRRNAIAEVYDLMRYVYPFEQVDVIEMDEFTVDPQEERSVR